MKCDQHPMMDAVGTCVYCGRGVCDDCKVRINDKIHCKECIEAGRVRGNEPPPQVYQPVPYYFLPPPPIIRMPPKPKGTPNAAPLRIGAFGGLFAAIGLFMMGGTVMFTSLFMIVALTVFAIGLVILAVGCYGIYWNFGCSWGLFGMISLPAMGASLLVFWVLLGGTLQALSTPFMFVMVPLLVITMVFVHLSIAHMRLHLPTNSRLYGFMNLKRIINYLAGAGVAAFFVTSIFLFFIAGAILFMDFYVLMSVPVPEPPGQQPQQPYYPPGQQQQPYYPPGQQQPYYPPGYNQPRY